jgi:hypothetical protein
MRQLDSMEMWHSPRREAETEGFQFLLQGLYLIWISQGLLGATLLRSSLTYPDQKNLDV